MIISGNVNRQILRENKFSINLNLSFNNCTGSSEVGVSGQQLTYKFKFVSGNIFDPENRYFSSYVPNESINIQTDFSGTAYNYSINGSRILNSGFKQNFYAEKFYINTTGTVLDASVEIKSRKPTLSLSVPDSFVIGSPFTGYLVTNSASGLKLFSGYFEPYSNLSLISSTTGIISSGSPCTIVMSTASQVVGRLTAKAFFDTSAGTYPIQFLINTTNAPYLNYIFEIVEGSNSLSSLSDPSSNDNTLKSASLMLNYSYQTNSTDLVPATLPLHVSLSYYSGTTGYYGLVTGISIESGGNGYLSTPTITITGGGGGSASGDAFLGFNSLNYDRVLGVRMTSFGSGYTSTPIVTFSGGTGIINGLMPTVASGTSLRASYTKSFTGCYNLTTGQDSNYVNYFNSSFISGASYSKTTSSIAQNSLVSIMIDYQTTFDRDSLIAKLVISGANNNIIERYITGIK